MKTRIAALLIVSGTVPGIVSAAGLPDGPYISTSASAIEEVEPDYAVIDLEFRVVEPSAEAARAATSDAQQRLIELLEPFGEALRDQRLETMRFGEEFEFDRQRQKQVQVGYFGSFAFRLEVDDLASLPKLHYALAGLELRSLGNPRFEVADPEAAERAVRKRALEKAARRAAELARAQGAQLGAVWGIIHEPMHDLAGRSPGVIAGQAMRPPVIRLGAAESTFALPLEPRPVRFEARVGVVFRIAR